MQLKSCAGKFHYSERVSTRGKDLVMLCNITFGNLICVYDFRTIVQKLRNKLYIEPEYFECVTISFSDLPGFVPWVASATPYEVIDLLNTIYSIFDDEITNHEVQKIETIGDCYMVILFSITAF